MKHVILPYQPLFRHKKDAYQQFLTDFPRQDTLIDGIQINTLTHFLQTLQIKIHPCLFSSIIHVSTQASMAGTYERLQQHYNTITNSTHGSCVPKPFGSRTNDRLVIHYVVVNACHVKVILEKRFGVITFVCDTPCITHIIDSFTMFELTPNYISDVCVSWFIQENK